MTGISGMLDLSIGTHQTMLAGHTWPVRCIAFSPNGSQLVSVSSNSVYVWNTETWAQYGAQDYQLVGRAEFSNDGRLILIHESYGEEWGGILQSYEEWGGIFQSYGEEYYVDASTLERVDPPESWVPANVSTFPAPRFPVFLSDDNRSLCLKKGDQTIHFCWFPDSFVACSKVAQYKDMVCLGGWRGEVLSIDLAGFEVPDI